MYVLFIVVFSVVLILNKFIKNIEYWISKLSTFLTFIAFISFSVFILNKFYNLSSQFQGSSLELLDLLMNNNSTYIYLATFAGLATFYQLLSDRSIAFGRKRHFKKRKRYRKSKERFEEDYRLRKIAMDYQAKKIKRLEKELEQFNKES